MVCGACQDRAAIINIALVFRYSKENETKYVRTKSLSVGRGFLVACAIDARVRWLNRLRALSTDRFSSGC